MIRFDIPFNNKVTRLQYELSFKLMFKKSFKNIRRLVIIGLVFLGLGIICGISDKHYFNPYTIISFIWFFIALFIGLPFYYILSKVKKSIKGLVDEANESKLTAHYEFTDDDIKFTNGIRSFEIKWSGIKSYTIVNDNIFIMISKSIEHSLIIGKIEVTEDNYNLLVDLLKSKVEFKEYKI